MRFLLNIGLYWVNIAPDEVGILELIICLVNDFEKCIKGSCMQTVCK